MIARTLRAGRLQRRQLAALAGGAIVLVLSGGLCAAAPSGNASQADVHPAPSHRGAPPAGAGEREWAFLAPQAPQSLLLDGVADADLSVLVGARGHVLVSEDAGASWTQVGVPTRRVLCAVAMLDASSIWVVGHDALILFSADGGRNWTVQHDAPEEESPLFDVWFENPRHGIAIGAYGLFLETHDGGETWSKRQLGELDRHLYALTEAADGDLYIAGESGTILRSRDRGATWTPLESPYFGSFFGILALRSGAVLAYGLRGNLYRSDDDGVSWQRIELPVRATLLSGTQAPSGVVVLVGLSGSVFFGDANGSAFDDRSRADRVGLAAALFMRGERLLLLGEDGVGWFDEAPHQVPRDRDEASP